MVYLYLYLPILAVYLVYYSDCDCPVLCSPVLLNYINWCIILIILIVLSKIFCNNSHK